MMDASWGSGSKNRLTSVSLATALSLLGCEGKHRPYPSNLALATANEAGSAGSSAGDLSESAQPGSGAATPNAVSTSGSDEMTSIGQLQPAGATAAGAAPPVCEEASTESCGPPQEEGICRFGTRTCSNGNWGNCMGAVLPASRDCSSAEDNDCDGLPDNRSDDVCRCSVNGRRACDEHPGLDGKGPCHAGEQLCVLGENSASSDWGPCVGAVGPSPSDSCTLPGDDATCDGTPNGGCSCVEGQMVACGPETDSGICQRGMSVCRNGAFTACQGAMFPSRRDCSSPQDNDCDGVPDNTLDTTCQCIPGQGNAPCTDPTRSRCTTEGACAPCQTNADCSLVSGGRNLCNMGVCTAPRCGDSVVQSERGEECDDGGTAPADGCTSDCRVAHAPVGASAYGGTHVCMLQPNGEVVCWGSNDQGELGNRTTTPGIQGATSPSGISDATQVAVGPDVTCAVRRSGRLACWGLHFTPTPTDVAGLTGVTQVAIGSIQLCVIRSSRVSCARNDSGPSFGAFADMGLDAVTQISAGNGHVCALRSDGSLRCWGSNGSGQLGVGQPSNPSLAPVLSQVTGVAEVSAGGDTTCVRLVDGNSQCFGNGPLGSRTAPEVSATPQQVVSVPNPLRFASLPSNRCALLADQSVRCWGIPPLGDTNGLPIVIPLPSRAVEIGAGSEVACAVLENLSVYCWGTALSVLGLTASPAGAQVPVQLTVP
jgi:cysteine-rich repeat protein